MSLSATLFGRDSAIFKATNILGLGIPGWLDKKFGPPETEGPRLSDLAIQTSTYGQEIPRVYATIAQSGNVMWLENGKLKEKVKKNKSGGKGGGGSSEPMKTYSYFATFHLGLCEGPIAGVRRIWCRDKLIYNAGSTDIDTIIASNNNAKGWRLYRGTDDQLPDPRYEAQYGAGNVSAHRGLAYIAFYDFALKDYGDTLEGAQFKVEVVAQSNSLAIEEISRTTLPAGAIRFPGNAVLIGDQAYGFVCTSLANPLIYRVSQGSVSLAADLSTGGWSISTGSGQYNTISITSRGPAWAAWSGGVTKINGVDYPVGAGDAARIAITPAGVIYSCGRSTGPLEIQKLNVSGAIQVYSANIEPWFQREVQAMAADGSHVYVLSASPSGGFSKITKLADSGGGLSFELEVSDTHNNSDFYISDDEEYLYVTGGIFSSTQVRIRKIKKSDLTVVSTVDYSVAQLPSATEPALRNYCRSIAGILTTITEENGYPQLVSYKLDQFLSSNLAIGEVIAAEAEQSGLIGPADIDTSMLSTSVRGYRVQGGTIRSAIEPLQALAAFDVVPSGYKIKFKPRGLASVATIPWEDLGASTGEVDEILSQSREMDTQLPARTTISYLDAEREYAIGEQYSERINTEAVNRVSQELAIVMPPDEAAGRAEVLQGLPWLERSGFSFTLPPTYLFLEVGDVVTILGRSATYELRLQDINYTSGGVLECKAAPNSAALYTPNAVGGAGVVPDGTISFPGPSIFVPLDIPVVDETVQNTLGFVCAMTGYSGSWTTGTLFRSNDGAQTWAELQGFAGKASIGTARGTLPASASTLIDQRTLAVDMISGTPESITRDQMLTGANYAAYGADGRWEIVRFQNAVFQADGSYLLSDFVRGDKGTEWATGLHQAGDYLVLLDDPDNAFIGSPIESIALERLFRGVTAGASIDTASDVAFAYRGVNLECLSPVYASGSRDGSSNFSGVFTRRSRLSSSWWVTGVQSPVGESVEAYEIEVMSGSVVTRTINVTSTSFSYSAADQTSDFGSTQAAITFRIYQLSQTVGRGYPLEITL